MINIKTTLFTITLSVFAAVLGAQSGSVVGFWEVTKVSMGDQSMTPVAKWSKINADGSYQTGNGWLQSARGTWTYDPATRVFSANDPLQVADPFGGFTVSFNENTMIWERQEEGATVRVTLKPITELPMAPADYLKGSWELVDRSKDGKSLLGESDADNKHRLLIRWDRRYANTTPEGVRKTGFWHIHSHKPEVTFLPHTPGQAPETWRVSVDATHLIMTGISVENEGVRKEYLRER